MLTAKIDDRVRGILSLGITTTLAMGARERTKHASQGELAALRKGYLKRALDVKSWMRSLSFKSDFGTIYRSFKQALIKKKYERTPSTVKEPKELSNINPLFPPAFFEVTKSERPMLLVFSESDRLYWDFDEKFAQPYSDQLAEVSSHS